MSKAWPGWMLYSIAERELRRVGLLSKSWRMLKSVPKRRFQIKPGRRRRKYWYIKRADFEYIMLETKALAVTDILDRKAAESGG